MSTDEIDLKLTEVEDRLSRNCDDREKLEVRLRRVQSEVRMKTAAKKVVV